MRGIKVAEEAPEVNHLLFADDSLLFFNATPKMASRVDSLLRRYCDASGQRINKDKSSIFFSKGCMDVLKNEVKQILEVQNEQLSDRSAQDRRTLLNRSQN